MPDYEKIADSVIPPSPPPDMDTVDPATLTDEQRAWYGLDHPRYQGLAEAKGYDQSTARLQIVHYTHEAMIDVIIAQPTVKQNDLAKMFDRSVPWISRILGSDAFQAALAKRREELSDPFLVATIEERFRGLAAQSLDILADKLEQTKNADLALKSLDVSVKALGYGSRGGGGQQNNQFIIQLPTKADDAASWVQNASPMKRIGNG